MWVQLSRNIELKALLYLIKGAFLHVWRRTICSSTDANIHVSLLSKNNFLNANENESVLEMDFCDRLCSAL